MAKLALDINVSKMTMRHQGARSLILFQEALSAFNHEVPGVQGPHNFSQGEEAVKDPDFLDRENWTWDQARNAWNNCYLAYSIEEVPAINQTKHLASALMLGVVVCGGCGMPPYLFPHGLKKGAKAYQEVLVDIMKPWLDATYARLGN